MRTCDAVMKRSPVLTDRWHYDVGLVLSGIQSCWGLTRDRRYFDYVKSNVDRLVGPGGVIKGYERDAYNLDDGGFAFTAFKDKPTGVGEGRAGADGVGAGTPGWRGICRDGVAADARRRKLAVWLHDSKQVGEVGAAEPALRLNRLRRTGSRVVVAN